MKKIFIYISFISSIFISCENVDVPNYDNPNLEKALKNPDDYPSILNGAYLSWWRATHTYSPYMTLSVAADHGSSSWGNFGMRGAGTVNAPYGLGNHNAINNTQTASYTEFLTNPWYRLYSSISTANDVLTGIRKNKGKVNNKEADTKQTEAQALFIRGLDYGYLALLFDRGFITTEDSDLANTVFTEKLLVDYTTLQKQAIKDLEEAISIINNLSTFEINQFNGISLNKSQSLALANTYIAKFLAQTPRSTTENEKVDWNKVLTVSKKGIKETFGPMGDGGNNWTHAFYRQGNAVWMRLDQKIVNMVDPNHPYPFPKSGSYKTPTSFPDSRFGDKKSGKWFVLAGNPRFRPGRGVYFFSYFKFNKYSGFIKDRSLKMPTVTKADNDLIQAEAIIRTGGNLSEAARLINLTRVKNGKLPAATGSDKELINKVLYERYLEAYEGPGNPFFDRRRTGTLGKGQFTQLPIPARELNTIGMKLYTFGGK